MSATMPTGEGAASERYPPSDPVTTAGRPRRTRAKASPVAAEASTQRPGRDGISRQRVIDAAIQCILDNGFYRASSNAIAEQAGVSWGVIQYHFGNRETLMLAVLEEGARRLNDVVLTAEITGKSVTERIAQYMDVLAAYYGSTDYLAFTQVLINLAHDPQTSRQARETMAHIAETANPELNRLQRKVLAGTGIRRHAMQELLFHSLRGFAVSHVMMTILPDQPASHRRILEQRELLAEALGLLIEAHGKRGT
jgi:TetR/AcrR family transcriptional regulator, regulator of cefoperazone and chloramphenicol sensitivity